MQKFKSLMMPMICLSIAMRADAQADGTQTTGAPRVLSGGVSHSEQLPSLPDNLKTGALFSESNLQSTMSVPGAAGIKNPTKAPPEPAQRSASRPVKQTLPVPKNAKTTNATMSSQAASKSIKAYLKQQARQGNSGTIGLKNYLGTSQSGPQTKAALNTGVQSSSAKLQSQISNDEKGAKQNISGAIPQRFQIPDWLAGNWNRTESTELSRTELPSHKNLKAGGKSITKVTDSFGSYRDFKGIYWQTFDPKKASGSVDRGDTTDYHSVSSYELSITSPRQVVVRLRATHVVVSKSTHRIVKSYQDEELNAFNEIDGTKLRTDSSTKVFNFAGKPLLLTTAVSYETK